MALTLRAAAPADATHMAALVNLAGGGLPVSVWAAKAAYGQDPLDFGRREAERDDSEMSWRKATLAEVDGVVAGLLISYKKDAAAIEIDSGTHPLFRPLIKLENQALKTRHVSVLGTYPGFRRQGVARALIEAAQQDPGEAGMSLIVTNANGSAQNFVEAMGYREAARVPLVRADWRTDSTEWLLMRRP